MATETAAARTLAVFLSRKGKVRYALMPADDGDHEVCALRNNPEFIAYLEEATKRALEGPRYTLKEVMVRLGMNEVAPTVRGKERNETDDARGSRPGRYIAYRPCRLQAAFRPAV